jgi:hypothetical protein
MHLENADEFLEWNIVGFWPIEFNAFGLIARL